METLLLIRQPMRLEAINKAGPLDKLLETSAYAFRAQFVYASRARLTARLGAKDAYQQFLTQLAQTHDNRRLDPSAKELDEAAFGDPRSWKIVAFRPRIDKAWTELRVVYQAVKANEPVFAMFRIRPVVEYLSSTPPLEEARVANNKVFLGLVSKHLMKNGGPNKAFVADQRTHGKAVAALMNELWAYNEETTMPYLRTFMLGIALEARMGGGSLRNADGTYKSGNGWAWSTQKPYETNDGTTQAYVNVRLPDSYEDKNVLMQASLPLDDFRRDLGKEDDMRCSQCHFRTSGQVIPSTTWPAFTLDVLQHQECRGKQMFTEVLGADAAKGLGCPLAP
jgi:hypothetical protein